MRLGIYIAKIIHKISSAILSISLVSLFLMVFFVAIDVIGRYLLDKPITGGMEIQELMMVLVVFMAMGIVTRDKAHVFVELLVMRIKGKASIILSSFTFLLSFLFVALLAWQTIKNGLGEIASSSGTFTPILEIPIGPFILVASLGLLLMALEFFIEVVVSIHRAALINPAVDQQPVTSSSATSKPEVTSDG